MAEEVMRYRTPPKRAFRKLGLGQLTDGRIKVIAGFRFRWWSPFERLEPLFVNARVIRVKGEAGKEARHVSG